MALRPARPEDHGAFVRLFVELGVPEPPPPPPLWEAELLPLTWFHDGPEGPLAYVVADVLGDLGYVVQLVVDASFRRQGAETLKVTVTDNAPLTGLLRSAGAKLMMEILELQGPLR